MRDRLQAGEGLLMRPWAPADAVAALAAMSEPSIRWQLPAPMAAVEDAERWIAARGERWESGEAHHFAVVDGAGTLLGNMAVGNVNHDHRTGFVSYWLAEAARGRGVATRACRALCRWSFDELDLFRLELGHRTNNPASCKVALGAGFTVEGYERQKLEYDGVRYDVERHARLATDPEPSVRD
ncbi:GNAT family protein [Streptomyces sp. NPDC001941]|uniref:GNAT family N-acetyltransferase n=1 Tax=Streptomyces sp. NPDC001941 TaxID=3154659 RepID=UPI0033167C65